MQWIKKAAILFFLYSYLWSSIIYADSLEKQRRLFCQARASLLSGHYQRFTTLQTSLKDYPLYPYLIYIKLKKPYFPKQSEALDKFLQIYKDTPLASQLRGEWLTDLVKKQDWIHFIRYYQPDYGTTLQCYYLKALLLTKQKPLAFKKIPSLWLRLNVTPPACRMVFSYWEHSGKLNKALLWKKVERGIQQNNTVQIQHLSQFLSKKEKKQMEHWRKVYHHPILIQKSKQFNWGNSIDKKILLSGIKRLADKNPYELTRIWPLLDKTYHFSEVEKQNLLRCLSIALARRADLEAGYWLKRVKPAYADKTLREWRVRYSLLTAKWDKVLYHLDHFSRVEQKLTSWRYWRARALEKTSHIQAAKVIYVSLAKEIDYYGVLASQRLRQKNYSPTVKKSKGDIISLQENTAIQRSRELYRLGFIVEARREWRWALDSMTPTQLEAASRLASQWKWYDLAIIGAAKAKIYQDIGLRFPLAYRDPVLTAAKKMHLNSAWIWAIMRQESAFMSNVQSSAGALGIMQIMPLTGKQLAKNLNLRAPNLFDPKINILLGSAYLQYLLKLFNGDITLATAAYNAGPARVKNYKALLRDGLSKDIWVEVLPWKETRDYVKGVILARSIYLGVQ